MDLKEFVRESNAIERIFRDPTQEEIDELERFINLNKITIEECEKFVSIYQPNAKLRDRYDMNVRIGRYYPPFGGPDIRKKFEDILNIAWNDPRALHISFECLHPFMDCNGRLGRALWLHEMKKWDMPIIGSFLQTFYYQVLEYYNH